MTRRNSRKKVLFIVPIIFVVVVLCALIIKRLRTNTGDVVVKEGTYRLSGNAKDKKGYVVISQSGTRIQLIDMDETLDKFTEDIRKVSIHARKAQMEEKGEEFTKEEEERVKNSTIDYKVEIGEQSIEFELDKESLLIEPFWEIETQLGLGYMGFNYLPREDTIIVDGYKYILEK